MNKKDLGYNKPLFILAFDHRASFAKKMFGITGEPTPEQTVQIADAKELVYEGFKAAVASGSVPKEEAAILCDEQFGEKVLKDAKEQGFIFAMAAEKSGQDEFDFQYGEEFGMHIEKFGPTFVKVLIRYNPEDDKEMNMRQQMKLKRLSEYCHDAGYKFLIEPLIPATEEQLSKLGGDKNRYDQELRPGLAVKMVKELQEAGVEPDVWKIEGMEQEKHYEEFVAQARSGGREHVASVILGRGADDQQVEKWLRAGIEVDGIVGFAIGRTIFWDALTAWREEKISRAEAAAQIGENYHRFYKVFSGK